MSDKRTVSTDALETLGTIIDANQKRDAIHLAVIPAVANEVLHAGQHVSIVDGIAESQGDTIGIVDPFLRAPVAKGQHFWLVIYPRVITSLRHVWTHPDLPDEVGAKADKFAGMSAAERWIREWAATIPLDYETVMYGADDMVRSVRKGGYGEYLCFGGLLEGRGVPEEFWPHYEAVRGEVVEEDHRRSFFTCSC